MAKKHQTTHPKATTNLLQGGWAGNRFNFITETSVSGGSHVDSLNTDRSCRSVNAVGHIVSGTTHVQTSIAHQTSGIVRHDLCHAMASSIFGRQASEGRPQQGAFCHVDSHSKIIFYLVISVMTKPAPFHGFIGQRKAVQVIKKQAEGSKLAGRTMPHLLLTGASGLGKTELAKAIAAEMGSGIHAIVADQHFDAKEALYDIRSFDVVFIDEAHALTKIAQESLFPFLDVAASGADPAAQELSVCTFVLATDQPGRLANALLKRFPMDVSLLAYSEPELVDIVAKMASANGLFMSGQARGLLARSSQGNPRVARHRVQCLCRYGSVPETMNVDQPTLTSFLSDHGIDAAFRDVRQQAYMECLLVLGGTASLDTIAGQLGTDADFLERQVEPFLLMQGWVTKSSRGRSLTEAGTASLHAQMSTNGSEQ